MLITCPHCQTQYQIAFEAIGAAGRKVRCAHCTQAWTQAPPPAPSDEIFPDLAEDGLDEALQAEERAALVEAAPAPPPPPPKAPPAAKPAPKLDAAAQERQQQAFSARQTAILNRLPLARLRRVSRWTLLAVFVGLLATAFWGRVAVVERFPSLAGAYAAIGLGVNVVGLDFDAVSTLLSLQDGEEVLTVSAQIVGLLPEPHPVPPVVVTLLDAHDAPIYQWSVVPSVRDLMAGERASFDTHLARPPAGAARLRLSFDGGDERDTTPAALASSHAAPSVSHAAAPTPPPPSEHH